MRKHATCDRGCPNDSAFQLSCGANENGRLCQKPAIAFDPQRGCFVCHEHTAQLVLSLRAEAAVCKP